jgi:hypothetical protein
MTLGRGKKMTGERVKGLLAGALIAIPVRGTGAFPIARNEKDFTGILTGKEHTGVCEARVNKPPRMRASASHAGPAAQLLPGVA